MKSVPALWPLILPFSFLSFLIRFVYGGSRARSDIKLIIFVSVWKYRKHLEDAAAAIAAQLLERASLAYLVGLIFCLSCVFYKYTGKASVKGETTEDNCYGWDALFLKPLLFPCRTSHTRLFPQKHSFSYSYLLVGIPIGWRGSVGSVLSADLIPIEGKGLGVQNGWYSVKGADYLHRGYDARGLHGKLDSYLKTQVFQESKP